MKNNYFLLVLITFLFFGTRGYSQVIDVSEDEGEEDRRGSTIVDDSTKQIFGPEDTRYTYQQYIKYNNLKAFTIDTLVHDLHRFHYVPMTGFTYQNLGNIGTALNPIFFQAPGELGKMPGIDIYAPYYKGPNEIRYYNSLSPFSRFKIIWGGGGRAVTEANYTRNINERINFGFEYKGHFIDKQINRQGRGDRQAQGVYYVLHGSYISPNRKYVLLGYFNRNRHRVEENGGVRTQTGLPDDEGFFDDNRQVYLNNTETSALRTNYHIYHQYELSGLIQLYHEFDRYKQMNRFSSSGQQDLDYFNEPLTDTDEAYDRNKFVMVRNEVGVKGDIGKTFYNFYYKARRVDQTYEKLNTDSIGLPAEDLEHFGGFNLRFGNDSLSYIETFGELQTTGNYLLGGRIRNTWFHAEASSRQTAPTYMHRAYLGTFTSWENDFDSQITTSISGGFDIGKGKFQFRPSAGYTLVSNYLYFQEFLDADSVFRVAPFQTSGDISILHAEFNFALTFLKRLSLISTTRFTNVSGGSAGAVQIPEIHHVSQLSYNNLLFDGNLEIQFGLDFRWQSDYYGLAYDPSIMQFYVQDRFNVYSYPLVDVFLNGRVNRGRWFLKLNNVTELIRDSGYFTTPLYTGQTTILDFGIDWIFFD